MTYSSVIFDMDYFSSHPEEEIRMLSDYIEEHDIHVAIVTNENKPVYTKWMKKAPLRVDFIIGGGDLKYKRFRFHRKPEPNQMHVAAAHLGRVACEVLAVCTKDIDREAAEAASMPLLINPSPQELLSRLTAEPRQAPAQRDLTGPVPTTGIYGAVCGDIIGTPYEHRSGRMQNYGFEMFAPKSHASDDSILTMAIARWLMNGRGMEELDRQLTLFANRHPKDGFGSGFLAWLNSADHSPRVAGSNGSAMRVSPVGHAADTLEETLELARLQASLTHNDPDGIHGAQAVAACVFLARTGKGKDEIKSYIEKQFGFDLGRTVDEIRKGYNPKDRIDCNCVRCAAEAIICWLQSDTYEQTVRNAVSLGGDADTLAAMAGAIAAATPGMEIPADIAEKCFCYLPEDLKETLLDFEQWLLQYRH